MITGWEAYFWTFIWFLIVIGAAALLLVAAYQLLDDWWDGRQAREIDTALDQLLKEEDPS